jgi:hypothetical protein
MPSLHQVIVSHAKTETDHNKKYQNTKFRLFARQLPGMVFDQPPRKDLFFVSHPPPFPAVMSNARNE